METTKFYRITVQGLVDLNWADWFDSMKLEHDEASCQTILLGPLQDQAALYGVLSKVRDLGLVLISVKPLDPASA
jgi:hypothetical protein